MEQMMKTLMAKMEAMEARLPAPVEVPVAAVEVPVAAVEVPVLRVRRVHCGHCAEEGHTIRSCSKKGFERKWNIESQKFDWVNAQGLMAPAAPVLQVDAPVFVPRAESIASVESFQSSVSTHRMPMNSYGRPIQTDNDCVAWFDKLMTKMNCEWGVSDTGIWYMLKSVYALDKTKFEVIGGLHTNVEGNRTYYSVRHHLIEDKSATIHIYGAARFGQFFVSELEYMILGKVYKCKFIFKRKPANSSWSGV